MCRRRGVYTCAWLPILGTLMIAAFVTGCKDSKDNGANAPAGGPGTQTATGASGDVILVGEYGSMTGKEATFGKSTDEGIQLAVDEINKSGGIQGKQVRIETEDDQSDAPKAETAVKRLIDEKHVIAVLGEVASGNSIAGGKICQQKGVPMISPSSTKPSVTEIGDFIFRVCFIDPFQSAVVARYARDGLKANRVAIFTDKASAYSVGFSNDFKKAFAQMGGQILVEKSYTGGDKDFRSGLTAIKALKPDAILVPGYYSDTGSIAKQARELDIKVPLLGGDGWDSQALFETGGDAVNGCYFSDHMAIDDPDPKVKGFVTSYRAKYGSKVPDALAALGYDAAGLLFDAMKRAKSLSSKDIRDAIAETKGFSGVTGKITMNAARNADKSAVIIAIQNRQFKYVTTIADPDRPMPSPAAK